MVLRTKESRKKRFEFTAPLCPDSVLEIDPLMTTIPSLPGPPLDLSFRLASLGTEDLDHTDNHDNCPACRAANLALQAEKTNISSLPFSHALKFWKLRRAQSPRLKERTHETTTAYLNALEKFFGSIQLRDITPGNVRAYQLARQANALRLGGKTTRPWKREAGNSTINHELSVLGQMLKHCKLWHRIQPFYFPLPVKGWSPREIFTEDEEERFFREASKHPEAAMAYWVAAITNNTTASGSELRGLRFRHLFLREGKDRRGRLEISEIYIPPEAVKNDTRPRKIALNKTAKWAVEQCYRRAIQLGCCEPDHFLFPFRLKRNQYDPERPPSRWFLRKSWDKLREATGFPELKPHDLRFLCITRMLENDVDPETVTAIAGHRPNSKMLEYYAKHRRRAKYAAVAAIEPKRKLPPKKSVRSVPSASPETRSRTKERITP